MQQLNSNIKLFTLILYSEISSESAPAPVSDSESVLTPPIVQYLLIGAGTASVSAMRAILKADPQAEVSVYNVILLYMMRSAYYSRVNIFCRNNKKRRPRAVKSKNTKYVLNCSDARIG